MHCVLVPRLRFTLTPSLPFSKILNVSLYPVHAVCTVLYSLQVSFVPSTVCVCFHTLFADLS